MEVTKKEEEEEKQQQQKKTKKIEEFVGITENFPIVVTEQRSRIRT